MNGDKAIRVLQVLPSMGHGGIEHFLINLYRAINKNKVQFDFIYRVPYECVFDKEITSLGGRIFRCVDPDRHPLVSARFYRKLLAEHPEIRAIHEHRSGCDGFFGLMRAGKKANVPVRILHSHSSQKSWKDNPIKDITDAYNAPRLDSFANYFIACSDLASTYLFGRCSSALDSCVVQPNAIDIESFVFNDADRDMVRARYAIDANSLVIGHVGRFVPEKNQTFLVEILTGLRQEGIAADLLLVGDGPLRKEVEQIAESRNVLKYVHFAGIQNDTSPFYSAMDAFCMPSIFEGLPVSCVEAQANGLPMVLSSGISRMADICGNTTFIEINESAIVWGREICAAVSGGRGSTYDLLHAAGYDIVDTAEKFEALYTSGVII